jgi:2-keto-4-pentenoate hydratase
MIDASDITTLGTTIAHEIVEKRAFDRHVVSIGTDLDLAYEIQDEVARQLQASKPHRKIGGYKIAFNKASSLQYYGLTEPCIAPVFADLIVPSGAVLDGANYRDLIIEPELVLTLSRDLPVRRCNREEILASLELVRPGFELLDPRNAFALDPTAAQAVAQGIYNVGAVIGGPGIAIESLNLATLTTSVAIDGNIVAEATGAAPQDPVEVVVWMTGVLADRGEQLRAGMSVLCGTHLPTRSVAAPAEVSVTMTGVGQAAFRRR